MYINICFPDPGNKETSPPLCSISVGLSWMSCKGCFRPAIGWCSGCRTVSRIKWLWCNNLGAPGDIPALGVLRDCAGALTDLAESRSGRLSLASGSDRAPGVEGEAPDTALSPGGSPRDGRREQRSEKVRKERERSPRREDKHPKRKERSKDRERRRRRRRASLSEERPKGEVVKEEAAPIEAKGHSPEAEVVEEESEEESPKVVDPPVGSPAVKKDGSVRGDSHRPLPGLTTIGTSFSAPTPEPYVPDRRGDGEAGRPPETGREESRERSELPRRRPSGGGESREAKAPSAASCGREDNRRERSKSKKKKKNKGLKKRIRGAEFRRRVDQDRQQWRQRRKQR